MKSLSQGFTNRISPQRYITDPAIYRKFISMYISTTVTVKWEIIPPKKKEMFIPYKLISDMTRNISKALVVVLSVEADWHSSAKLPLIKNVKQDVKYPVRQAHKQPNRHTYEFMNIN